MKIAHYIGTHAKDGLSSRLGWACTRSVQRGEYKKVTHVEAILAEHSDGSLTIASSSLRDGGVRAKYARLTPGSWIIADVPEWSVEKSWQWLWKTEGKPYDLFGALATVFPTKQNRSQYFCTEWVAAPFLHSPQIFGPAQLAAITFSIGKDVTEEFFASRDNKCQNQLQL